MDEDNWVFYAVSFYFQLIEGLFKEDGLIVVPIFPVGYPLARSEIGPVTPAVRFGATNGCMLDIDAVENCKKNLKPGRRSIQSTAAESQRLVLAGDFVVP